MHAVLEAPPLQWSELEEPEFEGRTDRMSDPEPLEHEAAEPEVAKPDGAKPQPSLRKLRANRRNARLSTGPRTPAGKARASVNASTHGLYCRALLLPGESEQELIAFRNSHLRALNPQTTHELMLVDQIFAASWKLRRLNSAERFLHHALIDGWRDRREALAAVGDPSRAAGDASPEEAIRHAPGFSLYLGLREESSRTIELYSRLEQRLINTIVRLQRCLHQAQLLRLDEPALRRSPCPFVPALEAKAEARAGSPGHHASGAATPVTATPQVARRVEPERAEEKRKIDRPVAAAQRSGERLAAAVDGVVGELLQGTPRDLRARASVQAAAPAAVTAGAAAVGSFCTMPVTTPPPSPARVEKAPIDPRKRRDQALVSAI